MSYKRVHFIKDKDGWILFFCDLVDYLPISNREKACCDSILAGESEADFRKSHNDTDLSLYRQYKKILNDDGSRALEIPPGKLRITLNAANTCNMNCGYCYANGGVYHSKEGLMSMDVALRAIDVFTEHFGEIGSVKFIGGEPLLNEDVVCGVCDYVREKVKQGKLPYMPDFIITTNGTILNERLIRYSIEYHWRVGLSFDGPEDIHDIVRTFRNGSSTTEVIKRNICRWQKATDGRCPSSVNACYSGIHQKYGFTVVDSVKYIKNTLGIEKVNIIPIDDSKDSHYSLLDDTCFVKAMQEILEEDSAEYRKYRFTKMKKLEMLLRAHLSMPRYICKAGLTNFGVSTNGALSPCNLLTDENGFYMGSIFDEDIFESKAFCAVSLQLKTFDRFKVQKCKSCYANRICPGCIGGNLFRTGDPYTSDPSICRMIRGAADELLKDIVHSDIKKCRCVK